MASSISEDFDQSDEFQSLSLEEEEIEDYRSNDGKKQEKQHSKSSDYENEGFDSYASIASESGSGTGSVEQDDSKKEKESVGVVSEIYSMDFDPAGQESIAAISSSKVSSDDDEVDVSGAKDAEASGVYEDSFIPEVSGSHNNQDFEKEVSAVYEDSFIPEVSGSHNSQDFEKEASGVYEDSFIPEVSGSHNSQDFEKEASGVYEDSFIPEVSGSHNSQIKEASAVYEDSFIPEVSSSQIKETYEDSFIPEVSNSHNESSIAYVPDAASSVAEQVNSVGYADSFVEEKPDTSIAEQIQDKSISSIQEEDDDDEGSTSQAEYSTDFESVPEYSQDFEEISNANLSLDDVTVEPSPTSRLLSIPKNKKLEEILSKKATYLRQKLLDSRQDRDENAENLVVDISVLNKCKERLTKPKTASSIPNDTRVPFPATLQRLQLQNLMNKMQQEVECEKPNKQKYWHTSGLNEVINRAYRKLGNFEYNQRMQQQQDAEYDVDFPILAVAATLPTVNRRHESPQEKKNEVQEEQGVPIQTQVQMLVSESQVIRERARNILKLSDCDEQRDEMEKGLKRSPMTRTKMMWIKSNGQQIRNAAEKVLSSTPVYDEDQVVPLVDIGHATRQEDNDSNGNVDAAALLERSKQLRDYADSLLCITMHK